MGVSSSRTAKVCANGKRGWFGTVGGGYGCGVAALGMVTVCVPLQSLCPTVAKVLEVPELQPFEI